MSENTTSEKTMRKWPLMLHKLNPANSLFGKIFMWFWLSVSMLLIAAFLLARLTRVPVDVSQPSNEQLVKAEQIKLSLETAIARGLPLERALRRVAQRGKWQLMLVNNERQDIILGFPAPMLVSKKPMLDLAESSQVVLVRTPTLEFIGPFAMQSNGGGYKLFVGRLLRRDERPPASWGFGLFVILTLGSLLCLLLAWRLSKPLGELGSVSRAFADGDLQRRVHNQKGRRDEIGQLAADFNTMADKLNASMQQQHLLLANISHELRTPLTRLQLSAAMLQDKYNADEYLARIELEIVNMDKLIGEILKLSRMQNAKSGLKGAAQQKFEQVDLVSMLSATVDSLNFEATAMKKQVICANLPSVSLHANSDALISAFENITRNAIKFASTSIWIEFEVSDREVYIHVDDDGKGLPDEQLTNLFEPFHQAQNASYGSMNHTMPNSADKQKNANNNNPVKGVGLGLAIAKAAVNLHDGKLLVGHSLKGGLRFTIVLPR